MCRAALLVAALFVAVGSDARAQGRRGTPPADVLLARADSLWRDVARRDSLAAQATFALRRARRFDAGRLTLVLPSAVGAATGGRIAAGAAAFLRDVVPDSFIASRVVVSPQATAVDSVLRAQGLDRRIPIVVGVEPRPDSLADGWNAAAEVARNFAQTLDSTWRGWLPLDLGLGWVLKRDGPSAAAELMKGDTRVGARCLEGDVGGCRLWLGLDRDSSRRYFAAELRRQVWRGRFFADSRGANLAQACLAGMDVQCLWLASYGYLAAIPAGPLVRSSVVGFVRDRMPAGALARALADDSGAVGERLARAAGVSEDSLVRAWRIWLLTGGGQPRVSASVHDLWPAVLFAGLLVWVAARGGRWR